MRSDQSVTFITRKWPPAVGGMETYSKELSARLAERFDLEVVALKGHADGGVPTAFELLCFGVKTAVRLLFARNPASVVHVADMASWPLALCARLRRPSVLRVLSAHGTDVTYPLRGGAKANLYRFYLRLGALLLGRVAVIANSRATAEVATQYGFRDICVVPLAAEIMHAENADRADERRIIFSGRLVAWKGVSWFIKNVLPHLPENITLDVAGTEWDAAERRALDAPRVRFLGHLDQPTLWRAQATATCVVMPNVPVPTGQFEGFGLVAVEAAAAGGIVLASRHGGLTDAVIDGVTGFLLPPEDAEAWIAMITEIAGWSSQTRAAFTRKSVAACAEHYSWKRVAEDTALQYSAAAHAG